MSGKKESTDLSEYLNSIKLSKWEIKKSLG